MVSQYTGKNFNSIDNKDTLVKCGDEYCYKNTTLCKIHSPLKKHLNSFCLVYHYPVYGASLSQ